MGKQSLAMANPVAALSRSGRLHDASESPACPVCGQHKLIRIHRRPIDRFWSIFGHLRRYRCYVFSCQWEGNLKEPVGR